MKPREIDEIPIAFWVYLGGLASVQLGLRIQSSLEVSHTVIGLIIEVALLIGLYRRSNLARWLLLAVGLLESVSMVILQLPALHFDATAVAAVAFIVSLILLLPSMRDYTRASVRPVQQSAP